MCDYSIRHVASRPAKVGDRLVTTSFGDSTNRGLAASGQPGVAVCVLPGTELALEQELRYEHPLGRFFPSLHSRKSRGYNVARFCQVNKDEIGVHHDALEFPSGKKVLVASIFENQYATVLQLPVFTSRADENHANTTAALETV